MAFHPLLDAAEGALLSGDRAQAASELGLLTDDEIAAFSEEEAGLYDFLLSSIEGGRRDEAAVELRSGLATGNMRMIRRAVVGLSGIDREEVSSLPGLARDLQRGQEAIRLYDKMQRAQRQGAMDTLLENASAMIAVLPASGSARQLREEAAAALEAAAVEFASSGEYLSAIAELEPLVRFWPDREGLEARIEDLRSLQQDAIERRTEEQAYEVFIETARERGRQGSPEEALRMIEARRPPVGFEEKKTALVTELRARLAELDANPPVIEMAADVDSQYLKNQPFTIACRITDDYRVVSASAMIAVDEASDYRVFPMTGPINGLYYLEVPPEVHRNSEVRMFVEARDESGHVGFLGSSEEPYVFRRRGFLKRILGD
jgi:hypothetical protein